MADPDALEAHRRQVVANRQYGAAGSGVFRPPPSPPSGGGGGFRPSVRPGSSGKYSRPMAPPAESSGAIPDINAFLSGDSGYQQQLREFAKALSDFTADVTRRRGSLTSDYTVSNKALNDQKMRDLKSLEEDYGSRGLLRSGLYGTAVGDYNKEFGERSSDLLRRQNEALASLTQEQGQFGSQLDLQKLAAREAAIRRRAEGYGVV
jgi:hypothetical protein